MTYKIVKSCHLSRYWSRGNLKISNRSLVQKKEVKNLFFLHFKRFFSLFGSGNRCFQHSSLTLLNH